jgi:branched-subunit amino acid transport protein AzlD
MCLIFSLIPATFLVIVGYFVLFSSTRTEGYVRKFGKVLAIWVFIIATLFPTMGAYVTLSGQCPIEEMMQQMHVPMEKMIK